MTVSQYIVLFFIEDEKFCMVTWGHGDRPLFFLVVEPKPITKIDV